MTATMPVPAVPVRTAASLPTDSAGATSDMPEQPDPPPRQHRQHQRKPTEPRKPAPPGHDLGRLGEDLAAHYLETLGLVLLCRNWRCRDGELDIVATDGRRLVVAEVKTRTTDDFGTPAEAMTPAKIRRIKAATHAWLRNFSVPWCEISYDLIAIWWPTTGRPRLQHRRGAF
jgi:putative endonuclease